MEEIRMKNWYIMLFLVLMVAGCAHNNGLLEVNFPPETVNDNTILEECVRDNTSPEDDIDECVEVCENGVMAQAILEIIIAQNASDDTVTPGMRENIKRTFLPEFCGRRVETMAKAMASKKAPESGIPVSIN